MSDPTPAEAADWLDVNWPDAIAQGEDHGRRLRILISHARATTPGDGDRGRELAAARAMLGEFIDEATRLGVPDIARAWLVGHDCSISLAVLRALAAPAETEVGDDDLAELIGELRDDSENLGTLALNAEGEHNYHDAMLLRGIGMDVDRAVARFAGITPGPERRSLVLADREAELLELKGPCSDPDCRLHYAHRGPHDIVGEDQ